MTAEEYRQERDLQRQVCAELANPDDEKCIGLFTLCIFGWAIMIILGLLVSFLVWWFVS